MDQKELKIREKKAKKAFDILCKSLDEDHWKYSISKDDLMVTYSERGDDLVMNCKIILDKERNVFRFLSKIPAEFPETEEAMQAAVACCIINNKLLYGAFDLNVSKGTIWYRMAYAFRDDVPGKDFFRKLRRLATTVIDKYNDRFEKLKKGELKAADIAND